MPLYEYKCTKCGAVFELMQKVNDPPLLKCVHCQGPVKKLLSPPSIQFKGSGWYVTDYAGKNTSASKTKPEQTPKKGEDTSTEKKPTSSSSGKK